MPTTPDGDPRRYAWLPVIDGVEMSEPAPGITIIIIRHPDRNDRKAYAEWASNTVHSLMTKLAGILPGIGRSDA